MEEQKVGNSDASVKAGPTLENLAPLSKAEREFLSLLWPTNLIHELAEERDHVAWATPVLIVGFVISCILSVVLGPISLILLSLGKSYDTVTDGYLPVALQVCMIISAVAAIITVVGLIQTWREQSKHSLSNVILGLGNSLMLFLIWLEAFGIKIRAWQFTLLFVLVLVVVLVCATILRKKIYETEQNHLGLHAMLLIGAILGCVEIIFGVTHFGIQIAGVEKVQTNLEELTANQLAARREGVANGLSDLVFNVCQGNYDVIYIPQENTETGLFECKQSHQVYSVNGPLDAQANMLTNSVVTGSAFYIGQTYNEKVAQYFPNDFGAKYLYRDLSQKDTPSELVMLVAAGNEDEMIAKVSEPLSNLINDVAKEEDNNMRISLFYNNEINSVYTTKDFVIMAAADTISLIDYLPNGNSISGSVNDKRGTYVYRPDTTLFALTDLGANPLVYSAQARSAITINRHATFVTNKDQFYTPDVMSDTIRQSMFEPLTGARISE